jgi:hypothetical protein
VNALLRWVRAQDFGEDALTRFARGPKSGTMNTRVMAPMRFLPAAVVMAALSPSAACGARTGPDGAYEAVDAGSVAVIDGGPEPEAVDAGLVAALDGGTEIGSNLKCRGGDCGGGICCASVTLDPAGGLAVSSAASGCSAGPCAMGQYQLCASDSECFEAGCVESPLGAGPMICSRACTPGETQCANPESQGVQTCTERYQWGATVKCTGDTSVCMNGACVECTLNTTRCLGGMVQECDPTGHWGASTTCPASMRCANGICL